MSPPRTRRSGPLHTARPAQAPSSAPTGDGSESARQGGERVPWPEHDPARCLTCSPWLNSAAYLLGAARAEADIETGITEFRDLVESSPEWKTERDGARVRVVPARAMLAGLLAHMEPQGGHS